MFLPHFHRQFRALSWLMMSMLAGAELAHAQKQNEPALVLRPSSLLQEVITPDARKQLPTFLESNSLTESASQLTVFEGQVLMRRGEVLLKADKVDYDQVQDFAKARGNVYINRAGNVYQGPALDLQLDAFEGFFTQPSYRLLKNNAYGNASRIDFIDPSHTVMHNANFTTCQRKPGPNWMPDWFFSGDKISTDADRHIGKIEGGSVSFKGLPILPIPAIDFPLDDERKSGLLPPSFGADNIGGLEFSQP
jgi:LPS-assembly protein